jgi:hypothetical protein
MSLTESGGIQIHGNSGEFGTLQYMPNTWKCVSREVMGEVLPQTTGNEWYVSVLKVQSLLDQNPNYTAYEIGMIWNGSLCGSEKPIAKQGTNKHKVKYNTVTHAKKVLENYYSLNAQQ